jgi:hypothetical protein
MGGPSHDADPSISAKPAMNPRPPMTAPLRCVPVQEPPLEVIRRHLPDSIHRWSVGTYGAIGEFEYESGEPGLHVDLDRLSIRSNRGAIGVDDLSEVRAFALIDDAGETCEIAFCTPRRGAGRTIVSDLDAMTFDIGIAAPHIDMLVRVAPHDADTAAALRACIGQPLSREAATAIGRTSPMRILVSPIARVEVDQPIPPPGGCSPEGPHTHLLPHLLALGLPHAPGSPLPSGLFCGLSLYPARPRS